MAVYPITWACGWEANDPLEGSWYNSALPGSTDFTTVAVPAAPIGGGNYSLLYTGLFAVADFYRWPAARRYGAIAFEWRPLTNPTEVAGVICMIAGVSNATLNGIWIGWRASDKQLCFVDNTGTAIVDDTTGVAPVTVRAGGYDATATAWFFLSFRFAGGVAQSRCWLDIYDNTRTLIESITLSTVAWLVGANPSRHQYGQVVGTSRCSFYLDNFALYTGGGLFPPVAPNFRADVPDATTLDLNDVNMVRSDTGLDAAATEYLMVNEFTLPDVDYVKAVNQSSAEQRFNHAAGLITLGGGDTLLAVGVTGRLYQTGGSSHQLKIWLSGVSTNGPAAAVQQSTASTYDSAWGYQHAVWSSTDPSGAAWTVANFDSVKLGDRHAGGGADEVRLSQLIIYGIYGPDTSGPASVVKRSQVV